MRFERLGKFELDLSGNESFYLATDPKWPITANFAKILTKSATFNVILCGSGCSERSLRDFYILKAS